MPSQLYPWGGGWRGPSLVLPAAAGPSPALQRPDSVFMLLTPASQEVSENQLSISLLKATEQSQREVEATPLQCHLRGTENPYLDLLDQHKAHVDNTVRSEVNMSTFSKVIGIHSLHPTPPSVWCQLFLIQSLPPALSQSKSGPFLYK